MFNKGKLISLKNKTFSFLCILIFGFSPIYVLIRNFYIVKTKERILNETNNIINKPPCFHSIYSHISLILVFSKLFLFTYTFSSTSVAQQTDNQSQGWKWQYPKPQGNSLSSIVVLDRNTAIASGASGTIIKTIDGGNSWAVKSNLADGDCLRLFFLDKRNGWALGPKTIMKTVDQAENWTVLLKDTSNGYNEGFNGIYFINKDTGFVCGNEGLIMRTTDAGKSWTKKRIIMGDENPNFLQIRFTDSFKGWAIGYGYYGNACFRTFDGGKNWQWVNLKPRQLILSDIIFTDKNTGYMTGDSCDIMKTTDGGNNWTGLPMGTIHLSSLYFTSSDTGFAVGVTEDPLNDALIMRTTDAGKSWTRQLTSKSISFGDISSSDGSIWVVGARGAIYKSTDYGINWNAQNDKRYKFRSIHFTDELNGWAAGEKGAILQTKDGGENWEIHNIADNILITAIQQTDEQNIFAVGAITEGTDPWPVYAVKAVILHSTDEGKTWITKTIDSLIRLDALCFISKEIGWIAVGSTIIMTTDGGLTWNYQNCNVSRNISNIQFINNHIGWAVLSVTNQILRTSDGGNSWIRQEVGPGIWLHSLYFVDENIGYAVGTHQGNNVFKTTDGGKTWNTKNINIPSCSLYSVFFVDANIGWVVGSYGLYNYGIVFKTTNGGENWIKQNCPSSESISSVYFINEKKGWMAGSGIFKTTTGGEILSVENGYNSKTSTLKQITLYQNYPNPFNPVTTISYTIPKHSFVELKVFDILGREITTLVTKEQSSGEYKVQFDASSLPSGIYIYTIKAGQYRASKKLTVLK